MNGAPDLPEEVREALAAGRKIEAIKRLRVATGMSLKDAKSRIDAQTSSGASRTHRPTEAEGGAGRLVLAAIVVAIAWIVYRFASRL